MQPRLRDSELIEQMQNGSKEAFEELFDRYYDLLHTFAKHLIKDTDAAEDIIQNVFIKVWIRKAQINSTLSLRSYLLVTTRNEIFDYMRLRYNLLRSGDDAALLSIPDNSPDVCEYIYTHERSGFIDAAMRSMPDKRREIFSMRYDRNMSNAEIARALNLSIRTVEKHIDLAIKQIRKTISIIILLIVFIF